LNAEVLKACSIWGRWCYVSVYKVWEWEISRLKLLLSRSEKYKSPDSIAVIVVGYHCYLLHAKSYQISFSGGYVYIQTAPVVYWSDFLAADPEVPGSIPGAARFSE
jgi:hypothetical protein